ncbi:MAG: DUF2145 domain-containing protein [Collimonas sp.]|uniref:DUF2145 domain-containing protein n=1 Tax=Collimonas sp. TaxID=1963772 RepID=UPI00326402BF
MLRRISCFLMLAIALHGVARAGQTCSDAPPRPDSVRMAFSSANDLSAALDKAQPQVALVARVGQDLSKYGLRYSHIAFVLKDPASGQWRTMHLLNACGTADSAIWKEGLANFFLDDLFSYESLLIIPSPEAQRKILVNLADPSKYLELFTPHYNMLAYPFATRYENSNQWVLELLTKMYADNIEIDSREKAQQWLKLMGYEPTTLNLGPMTRLGGRMFRANVAFDDHPNERRFADKIDIVTVVSMTQFLKKIDPATTLTVVPEPKLSALPN